MERLGAVCDEVVVAPGALGARAGSLADRVGRKPMVLRATVAIAVAMVAAVELALRGLLVAGAVIGAGSDPSGQGMVAMPLAPVGITLALLAAVLLAAKGAQLALRVSARVRAWRASTREGLCPQACTCCTEVRT